jgi:hypothetical protein
VWVAVTAPTSLKVVVTLQAVPRCDGLPGSAVVQQLPRRTHHPRQLQIHLLRALALLLRLAPQRCLRGHTRSAARVNRTIPHPTDNHPDWQQHVQRLPGHLLSNVMGQRLRLGLWLRPRTFSCAHDTSASLYWCSTEDRGVCAGTPFISSFSLATVPWGCTNIYPHARLERCSQVMLNASLVHPCSQHADFDNRHSWAVQ